MKTLFSIFVIGLVGPGIVALVLIGTGWMGWQIFFEELRLRKERFEQHQADSTQIMEQEPHAAAWAKSVEFYRTILSGDPYTEIGNQLRRAEEDSYGRVLRTSYRREGNGRSVGTILAGQSGDILEMGFRARFLDMQDVFARLEFTRPHLLLEQLKIEKFPMGAAGGSQGNLKFDVRYLAFSKEEKP